jgi:hypothetical protein
MYIIFIGLNSRDYSTTIGVAIRANALFPRKDRYSHFEPKRSIFTQAVLNDEETLQRTPFSARNGNRRVKTVASAEKTPIWNQHRIVKTTDMQTA